MLMWKGALLAVLICVDMGIKQYIEDFFEKGEERNTKVSKVVFRKVYNKGFVLDLLEEYPKIIRISSIVTGAVIAFYDGWLVLQKGKWLRKFGMTFMTAGAVSNIYDRLARGKVIDYIGFKSKNSFLSKITANLADFYVAAGALLVEISQIKSRKKRKKK